MLRKSPVYLSLLLVWLALGAPHSFAQSDSGAGDLFYKGYMLKTEAEKLEKAGDAASAVSKYQQARQLIGTVAQNYPGWQPEVVNYRLRLIEQSIARLSRQPGTTAPAQTYPMVTNTTPAAPAVAPSASAPAPFVNPLSPAPGANGELTNPLDIINQTFAAQQKQNAELKEKLRLYEDGYTNALRERQKYQEESGLLNKQLQDLTAKAEALASGINAKDKQSQEELQKAQNEVQMVKDMLAGRTQQLMETGKAIESLEKEKEALQADNKRLDDELVKTKRESIKPDEFTKIITENTRLKQELEVARVQVETLQKEGVRKDEEVVAMRTQIEGLQSEMSKLRQENTAYQGQVAELTLKLKSVNEMLASSPDGGRSAAEVAKTQEENKALRGIIMRQLRQQQRQLQTKELVLAEMKKMENVSQTLIDNLEDMASKPSLTEEEQSLFTAPELKEMFAEDTRLYATLEAVATNKPAQDSLPLPTASPSTETVSEESLLQEAQAALGLSDFPTATKSYQDVLRANPKNSIALTNLAGIKLQQKKYDEAEVLLQKCLFYSPDDDTAHYRLGICYFQQDRLEDALASFEKSVIKQKDNARAHHYLGIITNRQGNRPRAEAEFKSALAIDPQYAPANFNLAVLYATGTPPDWEQARKHYQAALDQGIKADPALEKLLQPTGTSAPGMNLREKSATANAR